MLKINDGNRLDFQVRQYAVDPDNRGYLYVVVDKTAPEFIKVGRTNNLHKRMLAYNADRPYPSVHLLAVSELFLDAKEVEVAILDYMKSITNGTVGKLEWFGVERLDAILELIAHYENKELPSE